MQPIVIGVVCFSLYGAFLCIRSIFRMYKDKDKKLMLWTLGGFAITPFLLWGALQLSESNMNIWFAIPILLLGVGWLSLGYFVEVYLRKEKQRKLDGIKRVVPVRPENHLRHNLILLAISIVVWIYGAVIGINNATVETFALCISMFLLARSVSSLWRYRGF